MFIDRNLGSYLIFAIILTVKHNSTDLVVRVGMTDDILQHQLGGAGENTSHGDLRAG